MRLEGDAWRRFFDSYTHSAWRLEVRAEYAVASEQYEYQRFLETGNLEIPQDDPWLTRVRDFRASGRTIGRVHAIKRPLTDYLRYEFEVYKYTVGAGEDVRILDLTESTNPEVPNVDFWMFDEQHVVLMLYREDGSQVGRELLQDPDMQTYIHYRNTALANAVPFDEYTAGFESGA